MFYIAVVKHAIIRHLVITFMTRIVNDIFLRQRRGFTSSYIYIYFFPLEVYNLPLLAALRASDINGVHLSYSGDLVT